MAGGKFLRIARADSPLSMERVRSYKAKGLRYLFIRNEDFGTYVGLNLGVSKPAMSTNSKIPADQKMRLLKLTSTLYLENLQVNGVSQTAYKDGCALVETTLANILRNDDLFILIDLLNSHDDRSYAHSLAVSLYSTLVAKQLGWESPATLFKVAMAGLLIDVGEKEISSEIVNKYHTNRIAMTADEILQYETHPMNRILSPALDSGETYEHSGRFRKHSLGEHVRSHCLKPRRRNNCSLNLGKIDSDK